MLPRVLLIGDSIRMGYAPLVEQKLDDRAEIVQIPQNGGDSLNVRTHLEEWLQLAKANSLRVVHLNCGLHDIKRAFDSTERRQSPEAYEQNLRQIVIYLQAHTPAHLIWARTTPVIHARHHATKGFDRFVEDVQLYNEIADRVMQEASVPTEDLFTVIADDSPEECIGRDGVHMTPRGNERLANAAVSALLPYLG